MRIACSTAELRSMLAAQRAGKRMALVPTMGCLHEGHARLMREARKLADIVVVSVYVNPLQFGPNEDFASYPRSFEADAVLCEAEGVDVIFHPDHLYPEGGPKITLTVCGLGDVLCGASRPGHFDGVVTVVNILFNAVQPDIAVFGEKDWQQLSIIRRMAGDLHMNVEIVGVPTVREATGLAMSSRNRYLSAIEKNTARALSKALTTMQQHAARGELVVAALIAAGKAELDAAGIEPEYLEVLDAVSMQEMEILGANPARALIAARVGPARLIDNIAIAKESENL